MTTPRPGSGMLPLFATPFSPAYWRCAARELRQLRTLTLAALFVGLRIVISSFYIPVGENLYIYFNFFVTGLGSLIYGPLVGFGAGFVSDILSFIVHPIGGFFPGYTLTEMLSGMTYGLFLYRARISVVRVALCKLTVNLLINVALGSVWSAILYGKGYYYYLAKSVVKNLLLWPLEVILLVAFLQLMLPVLARTRLTPLQPSKRIRFI